MLPEKKAIDMTAPRLTLRAIRSVAVEVPMRFPLGTSAATLRSAPLLLIDDGRHLE